MRAFMIVFASVLALGCRLGPNVDHYQPAKGPAGVEARVIATGRPLVRAELLAVSDSGLLVHRADGLAFYAYPIIHSATFTQGPVVIRNGRFDSERGSATLRLLARFPQGVDAALLARLQQAYGVAPRDSVVPSRQ